MALSWRPRGGAKRACSLAIALLGCAAGGALSVGLGQDATWDLRNYHLYVPWSYLSDRGAVDLAPAQMQSYFNPWIDVPYHWVLNHGGARCATFMLGVWQTIALVALYTLARQSVGRGTALLATLGAALSPIFLYQFGSTMGDDTGAVLVMTGVCCMSAALPLLHEARPQRRTLAMVLAAGIAVGAAAGLKLTNGPMALALCAMPMTATAPLSRRVAWVAVAGLAAGGGLLASGGHWYIAMWREFGNPLFPQFNTVFHSPLAPPLGIVDHAWGPVGIRQKLLWPFIFTVRPYLFGEISMVSLLLPVAYIAICIRAIVLLRHFLQGRRERASQTDAICVFVAVAYLSWMLVFGIGRYLVVVEMLCPLLLILLWRSWRGSTSGVAVVAGGIILACVLSVVNMKSWGKAGFAAQDFVVELPSLPEPQHSAVVFVGRTPQSWMATHFPAQVAFGAIASNLVESPAFRQRIRGWFAAREHVVAVFPLPRRPSEHGAVLRRDLPTVSLFGPVVDFISRVEAFASDEPCRRAASWVGRLFYKGVLQSDVTAGADGRPRCRLTLLPSETPVPFETGAERAQDEARASLASRGQHLDPSRCSDHNAWIGDVNFPYRACALRPMP